MVYCSDLVLTLAYIGGVVVYALVGLIVAAFISSLTKNCTKGDREFFVVIGGVFWPIAIIIGVLFVIGMWILFPFVGATREQLDRVENRLERKIDRECSCSVDLCDDLDIFDAEPSFKVGNVITGIVPQTDRKGNIMSYKHLYQGCKCRVLSIDSNDSMKVILIDHKDKAAHAHKIGETFTAPARNFTLVKKVAKKRKVANRRTKR